MVVYDPRERLTAVEVVARLQAYGKSQRAGVDFYQWQISPFQVGSRSPGIVYNWMRQAEPVQLLG